jgi:hypothetical protein
MHEELTQTRLKTGEMLRVMVVEAPDQEHAGTVLNLLSHKGELRQWQFQEDFAGRAAGLGSRYYLGFLEGRAVANVSVWETGLTGNLGHVHTLESQRRKGICKAVMAAQMADFRRRGGQLLVLGTGYGSPAYQIYRSFGFESMTPGSGAMQYLPDAGFYRRFFAPGPTAWGALQWSDLGTMCALMACPQGDWLRSMRARKYGPGCFEAAFLDDVAQAQAGNRQVQVARTASGVAAGYAALAPDPTWSGQSWLLDLFIHPAFACCAKSLPDAFQWPAAPVHCYLDAGSCGEGVLAAAGFRREALLTGCLQRQGEPLDVVLMTRS